MATKTTIIRRPKLSRPATVALAADVYVDLITRLDATAR